MSPFVSIIVPAYNSEATLLYTLEDILNQTYTNFELILVDDGSTDKTPALCDEIAAENSKIRVIHQKNGGPSNARNNGIKVAAGEYVSFVDSDDRIERCYLEYLIRALKETGADFVAAQADRVREAQKRFIPAGAYRAIRLSQKEALSALGIGELPGGPVCKLIKKEYYLQNPFLEGKFYEDLSNTYRILLQQNAVTLMPLVLYHYTMRASSITARKHPNLQQCEDYYEAISLYSKGVLIHYPDLEPDVSVLKARDCMSLYLSIHRCPERDKLRSMEAELVGWMRTNWKTAAANPKIPHSVRLRIILFGISPSLYKRLYYLGIKFKGIALG